MYLFGGFWDYFDRCVCICVWSLVREKVKMFKKGKANKTTEESELMYLPRNQVSSPKKKEEKKFDLSYTRLPLANIK